MIAVPDWAVYLAFWAPVWIPIAWIGGVHPLFCFAMWILTAGDERWIR